MWTEVLLIFVIRDKKKERKERQKYISTLYKGNYYFLDYISMNKKLNVKNII